MKTSTKVTTYQSISEFLFLRGFQSNIPGDLIQTEKLIRIIVLVVSGFSLISICAQVYIPLYPVPITMQTFAVFLIGLTYGWSLGGITIAMYLIGGAIGLPVFAKGGFGMAYFTGPTGGFLFGFFFAAIVCGWFAERGFDRSYVKLFISLMIGNILLYITGLVWLGNFIGWEKPVLELGLYPFLIGDIIKIFLVVIILPSAWKLVNSLKI